MLMDNFNRCAIGTGKNFYNKMQRSYRIQQGNLTRNFCQKFLGAGNIGFGYVGKNLKSLIGIAADNADCRRRRNSLHIARIRDGNALYIFNNVTAAFDTHAVGNFAEQSTGMSARIRYGNRFGTAERRNQLFLKDRNKLITVEVCEFHTLRLF